MFHGFVAYSISLSISSCRFTVKIFLFDPSHRSNEPAINHVMSSLQWGIYNLHQEKPSMAMHSGACIKMSAAKCPNRSCKPTGLVQPGRVGFTCVVRTESCRKVKPTEPSAWLSAAAPSSRPPLPPAHPSPNHRSYYIYVYLYSGLDDEILYVIQTGACCRVYGSSYTFNLSRYTAKGWGKGWRIEEEKSRSYRSIR